MSILVCYSPVNLLLFSIIAGSLAQSAGDYRSSGDGDFDLLAHRIRTKKSSTIEIYGVETLTAASLVESASRFIPIEQSLLISSNPER